MIAPKTGFACRRGAGVKVLATAAPGKDVAPETASRRWRGERSLIILIDGTMGVSSFLADDSGHSGIPAARRAAGAEMAIRPRHSAALSK
jgi:hypothetical protein